MLLESIRIAFSGLAANKLRALLTMLGIIIGVAAVIAMVSIGLGVRQKVENSIAGLGSNLLIITPGTASSGGARQAAGSGITLSVKDAEAIAREIPGVSLTAPAVSRQYQVIYSNQNWMTSVQGTTPDFMAARNLELEQGRFLSSQDVESRSRVVVIGKTVADNLFNGVSPVGQTIRINKDP